MNRKHMNKRRLAQVGLLLLSLGPVSCSSLRNQAPEPTDLAEAHWIGCSYVITSVEQGKAEVTNSFELAGVDEDDKKFVDEKIVV